MSTTPSDLRSPTEADLVRGLGPWQATSIVVSTIIGTGVFLVASSMARAAGSEELVLIAWILGTLIALSGTFCFAELGAALPQAGGLFIYLSRGLGPVWGFLFGWMDTFLGAPVAFATLAAGFVRFSSFLFPAINAPWVTFQMGHHQFVFTAGQPFAAAIVLAVAALNFLSVRVGGGVQFLLGSLKVGAIAAIIVAGVLLARPTPEVVAASLPAANAGVLGAVLSALVPVMWAYNGFQMLGSLGAEVRQPSKNIPLALLGGLLIVTTLYVLVNLTYFHVLPFRLVAMSKNVASDVVRSLLGQGIATWLTAVMGISVLATLHAIIMADGRNLYAMARAGLFFKVAARVQPRSHTPFGAILLLGLLGALIALTGSFEQLFSLYVFVMWIFLALGTLTVIRLRVTEPELPRPYRAWGYPWTPVLFATASVALTVNIWIGQPVRSSLGLLVIIAGLPFYYIWRRRQQAASASVEQSSQVE